jgi:SAM-dependent methyltransferase
LLPNLQSLFPTKSALRDGIFFVNWGFFPDDTQDFSNFLNGIPDNLKRFPYGGYHYYRLLSKIDPNNKSILEVGCGKGFGCKYVVNQFFNPKSYVGLDLSSTHIKNCNNHDLNGCFEFIKGSAQDIPLPDNSFDIVLNVESSHCYPSFDGFLSEVKRVLKPGGLFLFTDLRWGESLETIEEQLNSSGLKVLSFDDISKNVLRARESVSGKMISLDQKILDSISVLANHYCLKGSGSFAMLKDGRMKYFDATLSKP